MHPDNSNNIYFVATGNGGTNLAPVSKNITVQYSNIYLYFELKIRSVGCLSVSKVQKA